MEVILKQDVQGTGKAGDVVKVKDGYARNKLIPSGLAIEATKGNLNMVEKIKAKAAEKLAQDKAEAEEFARKITGTEVVLKSKVGEGGKLFGSITSMDIAEALKEQLGEEIDKRKIALEKPIKETGVEEVEIKLFQDVAAKIKVRIEGGGEEVAAAEAAPEESPAEEAPAEEAEAEESAAEEAAEEAAPEEEKEEE